MFERFEKLKKRAEENGYEYHWNEREGQHEFRKYEEVEETISYMTDNGKEYGTEKRKELVETISVYDYCNEDLGTDWDKVCDELEKEM